MAAKESRETLSYQSRTGGRHPFGEVTIYLSHFSRKTSYYNRILRCNQDNILGVGIEVSPYE